MVNLYIFHTPQKCHTLSRLILKGIKRLFNTSKPSTSPQPEIENEDESEKDHNRPSPLELVDINAPRIPETGFTRDSEYYEQDMTDGFCIFAVENTLFKVHKCYLLREPSTFSDLLSLPYLQGLNGGHSDEWPITLSDTAEQFRDLLWVLYATPAQLVLEEAYPPCISRILNIALLASKYSITSYKAWAIGRLFSLVRDPKGFLKYSTPEQCAITIDIVTQVDDELSGIIIQQLIPRMLWSNMECKPILAVAKSRNIRVLRGICYYKELQKYERHEMLRLWRGGVGPTDPKFPEDMNEQTREELMAAHNSLARLWEGLRSSAPEFSHSNCANHSKCREAWEEMWETAAIAIPTQRRSCADVLGRLRATMIVLKKSISEQHDMSLECTLAALESFTSLRENIVEGLGDHFQGELHY